MQSVMTRIAISEKPGDRKSVRILIFTALTSASSRFQLQLDAGLFADQSRVAEGPSGMVVDRVHAVFLLRAQDQTVVSNPGRRRAF